MGKTKEVCKVYKNADLFVFPSAFEGFGLSLVEAMSAGLPCIGYRSTCGVNEIIKNGKNGLLVDDGVDALTNGLKILMNDQRKRIVMGEYAQSYAKLYSPERVWEQWEKILEGSRNE